MAPWDVSTDGSQKNNKLAFEESVRAITSLYEGDWRDKREVVAENALDLTMAVSSTMWFPIGGDSDRPLRRLS